jgi:cyclopropane fatty-acyl-phospholipid synthase-like methyltransferase
MRHRRSIVLLAAISLASLSACSTSKSAEASGEMKEEQVDEGSRHRGGNGARHSKTHAKHHEKHHDRHHGFDNPKERAEEWNDPERDDWQKPGQVLDVMGVDKGQTVVDLGTGTGYFLPHLSKAVGAEGKVLALDVSETMLEYVGETIRPKLAHDHLETRRVERDDPGLASNSVDRILTVNTWHHVKNRVDYAKKIADALKPNGRFVDVDYTMEAEQGPPKEMKLTPEEVEKELERAGLEAQIVEESLPKQYIVVATPK